jgi:hypothetical protein
MRIRRIDLRNVWGLPDGRISFAGKTSEQAARVVLVTSARDGAASRLLETIIAAKEAIAAYGPHRSRVRPAKPESAAEIGILWELNAAEMAAGETDAEVVESWAQFGDPSRRSSEHPTALKRALGEYRHEPTKSKVEYFHAERLLPWVQQDPLPVAIEQRMRLEPSNDKFAGLTGWAAVEILRDRLALADTLRERGVVLRGRDSEREAELGRVVGRFLKSSALHGLDDRQHLSFTTPDGLRLGVEELTAQERQGLLFALSFRRNGIHRSLVLVDTPEAHVVPSAQRSFLEEITRLGEENQVIAATHSTSLLSDPSAVVVNLSDVGAGAR